MIKQRKSVSLIGFYILVAYVLLQFVWWSFLMLGLNKEIVNLKTENALIKSNNTIETEINSKALMGALHKKKLMIIGEGSVFLSLLLLGSLQIRRSFKKERENAFQQSNFLLSVTHELKSPIASTRLQLETLALRPNMGSAIQQQLIQQALHDTERLNALVENILMATQIDKHNFSIVRETTDVSHYITSLLQQHRLAEKHIIKMAIEPHVMLRVDNIYFASILINLIENAAKYSPIATEITVSLKTMGKKVQLRVNDLGVGIPDDFKKQVFQKFFRVGDERTRTSKGTGLGLYIVQKMVEQHDGVIYIEDNQPKGSSFVIDFKLGS